MSYIGGKVPKVVHFDVDEVVFLADQICPLIKFLKPILIRMLTALGDSVVVDVFSILVYY